jgi:hypothetical protein
VIVGSKGEADAYMKGAEHCAEVMVGELRRLATRLEKELADLPGPQRQTVIETVEGCADHVAGAFERTAPDIRKLVDFLADLAPPATS